MEKAKTCCTKAEEKVLVTALKSPVSAKIYAELISKVPPNWIISNYVTVFLCSYGLYLCKNLLSCNKTCFT